MLSASTLITGVGLGSMYGLVALGFHVTYAVSGTVNFAQGATMMIGAVVCFTLLATYGMLPAAAVALALVACAIWSVLVERLAVRPFVQRGSNSWLMATVALGIVIENVVLFTFGTGPVRGFAVVLSLGIVTSMFTALVGSRSLIHLIWGRRRKLERLPIGGGF